MKVFGDKVNKRSTYYVFRDYITKDINVSTTDLWSRIKCRLWFLCKRIDRIAHQFAFVTKHTKA